MLVFRLDYSEPRAGAAQEVAECSGVVVARRKWRCSGLFARFFEYNQINTSVSFCRLALVNIGSKHLQCFGAFLLGGFILALQRFRLRTPRAHPVRR